jgi:general secretion pathway protein L
MGKITLGLDIGHYSIKGVRPQGRVQSLFGGGAADSFEKVLPKDEGSDPFTLLSPAQLTALRELVAEGKITASDTIAVALPGHLISTREITLPFTQPQKIRKTIYYEVEDQLPFDLDEVVIDYQILESQSEKTRLLVFAAPKSLLTTYLASLQSVGIDPVFVSVDQTAFYHHILRNGLLQGKNGLFIDLGATKTVLCGIHQGALSWTRTTAVGTDFFVDLLKETFHCSWKEAEQMLTRLNEPVTGEAAPSEVLLKELKSWITDVEVGITKTASDTAVPLYLCGGTRTGLEKFLSNALHRELVVIDKNASSPCFALATGLTLLPADAINFRRDAFIHPKEKVHDNWLVSTGVISLFILGMGTANFYLHSLEKEKQFKTLKENMKGDFRAVFPEVKQVVNEVKQTEVAISDIRKQSDFFGVGMPPPLLILKQVTDAVPHGVKIFVTEFDVEQKKVRIEAQTTSFSAVDQIRSALMKVESFEEVAVSDAKVTDDGSRIGFRIQIVLMTNKQGVTTLP